KENVMATEQQPSIEPADDKIAVRLMRLTERARLPTLGSAHAAEDAVVSSRGKLDDPNHVIPRDENKQMQSFEVPEDGD
ncbi:hypothetical protein PMAYCL1PPCAC_27305, partial [Pristionchus mayeri]